MKHDHVTHGSMALFAILRLPDIHVYGRKRTSATQNYLIRQYKSCLVRPKLSKLLKLS